MITSAHVESQNQTYVLVTTARNEEALILNTIDSVISQTLLPAKWVIVSDGSTDRTDSIVAGFLQEFRWMELVRVSGHSRRNYASKVRCFKAGYETLNGLDYGFIGSLDADVSFGNDYFEFLLRQFTEWPELGVAGTPFTEGGKRCYDYRFANIEHVSGTCQLFRRNCFEAVGGYVPIEIGGEDWMAVTTARMLGWKTRTFLQRTCVHHRQMGTANCNSLVASFRHGIMDYCVGAHPLWQFCRSVYQASRKPFVLKGALLLAGYGWGWLSRTHKPVSQELETFHRREQMSRLRRIVARIFRRLTTSLPTG